MIIQKNDYVINSRHDIHFKCSAKERMYVQYQLKSHGLSFRDCGDIVGTSGELVLQIVKGVKRSRRVEAEIARILGHAEWNDVVMEARLAVSGVGKPTKSQIQKAKAQAIKEHQELINRKRKAFRSKVTKTSKEAAA